MRASALGLSLIGHLLVALAAWAAWAPLQALDEPRRGQPREPIVEAELLDDSSPDVSIVDQSDALEETPQGDPSKTTLAGDSVPAPRAQATATVAPTPPAPPPTPTHATAPPQSSASSSAATTAPSGPTSSPSALASASSGDGPGPAGAGQPTPAAPHLVARFTHDLAQFGAGVAAWTDAAAGRESSAVFLLALNDEGRVDRNAELTAAGTAIDPALLESVKRTRAALVTKLGPPGARARLKVTAKVLDLPPPEGETLSLSFDSFDKASRRGASTFVLGSGRGVRFTVEELALEPLSKP